MTGGGQGQHRTRSSHARRVASSAPAGANRACALAIRLVFRLPYFVLCGVALFGAACGTGLPEPEYARQPRSAYLPVPYPPPASFSEVVPAAPNSKVVWVDGHWVWRGRTYIWQRGGWMLPPVGARVALWHV